MADDYGSRTILEEFRDALAFLTILPATRSGSGEAMPSFRQAARTFPFVGALVGILAGFAGWLAWEAGFPVLLIAAIIIFSTVLLTGGLHEDGLADTADGFGGGATIERKLQIMDDSRLGTYGALALIFSILFRIGAIAAVVPVGAGKAAALIIAAEAFSRCALVRLWHDLPAARPGGLSEQSGPPDEQSTLLATVIGVLIAAALLTPIFGLWAAVVAIGMSAFSGFVFARLVATQIGGRTGDTLGACQQITAIMLMLSAVPFV